MSNHSVHHHIESHFWHHVVVLTESPSWVGDIREVPTTHLITVLRPHSGHSTCHFLLDFPLVVVLITRSQANGCHPAGHMCLHMGASWSIQLYCCINSSPPGQNGRHSACQTTFLNAFSWMKMTESQFKFHWNLFPGVQLTISQHWFR